MNTYTATYSPEDNKLRLYASGRLDSDLYQESRVCGFKWAPKQDLFYAHWTPKAEDFLLQLVDEIDDEAISLLDRAIDRSDRFSGYSEKRLNEAEQEYSRVQELTDNIPPGQPILIGHHSEKAARKIANKVEKSAEKTTRLWETSKYWEYRANSVIRSANFKDRPDVRARRIKKLEAENRKFKKIVNNSQQLLDMWNNPELDHKMAIKISNYFDHSSFRFTLCEYPRNPPVSQYEGHISLYSALTEGIIDYKQAQDLATKHKPGTIAYYNRLIQHNELRLTYEKTLLENQGQSDLLKPKSRPKQPPLLNYRKPEGIDVENRYYKNEFIHLPQVELTKAEYAKVYKDYKGTSKINGHRVRTVSNSAIGLGGYSMSCVFLTDSKVHPEPE